MTIRRLVTLVLWAMLACGNARAQVLESIEVVDYGIYTARTTEQWRGADGILRNNWVEICHIATTTKVPARLELILGFHYVVHGKPPGAFVDLRHVTSFPSPILPPGHAKPVARLERRRVPAMGTREFAAYAFDEPVELVTGRWVFEIWHRDRKRLEKSFDVFTDDGGRLPGAGSGGAGCFKAS